MTFRVVVLVSGSGTLLQALIDDAAQPGCPYSVVAVGSDRPDSYGLARARHAAIPTFVCSLHPYAAVGSPQRAAWDRRLAEEVAAHQPDLVVSAGFMKLVGQGFLEHYAGRFINTHPSLLPDFPGAHAVRDALDAGVTQTGASIFWVDSGVDTGQLLGQRRVPIEADDTEETLHERIKIQERELLVDTVRTLARTDQ